MKLLELNQKLEDFERDNGVDLELIINSEPYNVKVGLMATVSTFKGDKFFIERRIGKRSLDSANADVFSHELNLLLGELEQSINNTNLQELR